MIVVEHQDRAMRCGFRFLATPLEQQEQRIEVVTLAETECEDLVADLLAGVSSYYAWL
jgi:predicted site-specific integrase-resolvase